jgi:Ca-activated chloride channel family protein
MRFVHPWLLLLLTAVPLLGLAWFALARAAARGLGRLVSPALQARLLPPAAAGRGHAQIALALAGLALLVAAAARPQWGRQPVQVHARGRNLVIALDVSRSMLARDVHPNRLERARVDLMDLIGDLKGDRAALLAFRRRGVLLCPLTTDYAFLRQALDGVSTDSAPRGETDLADAIRKSLEALRTAPDDHNAILLISDGEDLAGAALEAAREAGRRGVPVFTVGLGDTSGAAIPGDDNRSDVVYQGQPVRTRLMEETLSAIARESGGRYVPLGTAGTAQTTLGAIFRQHLRQVAARELQERLEQRRVERYQWFLFPALALLLAAAALSRGRFSDDLPARAARPPSLPRAAALLVLLLALPVRALPPSPDPPSPLSATSSVPASAASVVSVPPGRAGARHAQALCNRGRYREAAEAYSAAARGAEPDEAQAYLLNAALALRRAGDNRGAIALLQPLLRGRRTADRAAELLGLAAFDAAAATNGPGAAAAKVEALEEAGGAFQQALRGRPDETRRQRNLARVEMQLPALREEARIDRLLQQYGQTPPDQLIGRMLREQRSLLPAASEAFTNEAPRQIAALETLAGRQDANADLWVPVKRALLESPAITNVQQRAQFEQGIEMTRDLMAAAAGRLRDVDPAGLADVARAEAPVYLFWKGLAAPPPLLDEDIALQSNALARADRPIVGTRPDQPEALELTRLFQERFPVWADQVAQQAQSDTNAPTLKPEDRAEIERLTAATIPLQEGPSAADRRQALKNLLRIRELLPKQKQPQPQPQEQPQPQPEQQPPRPQPPEEPPEPKEQEPQEEPQPPPQEQPPPSVQDLLDRALQREKEHEAEKRERMNRIPMLPNERDW